MATHEVLTLEVATPTGMKLRVEAESVEAPSVNGEFGVLPGHLPLLAAMRCGLLHYKVAGKPHVAAVGPGFAEAEPDRVLLLTDMFAKPEDIDADAVRAELKEAEERLKAFGDFHSGPEFQELQRDIDWAQARLDASAVARA